MATYIKRLFRVATTCSIDNKLVEGYSNCKYEGDHEGENEGGESEASE